MLTTFENFRHKKKNGEDFINEMGNTPSSNGRGDKRSDLQMFQDSNVESIEEKKKKLKKAFLAQSDNPSGGTQLVPVTNWRRLARCLSVIASSILQNKSTVGCELLKPPSYRVFFLQSDTEI